MINKIKFDGIPNEAIFELKSPSYENIMKASIQNSDAVIIASENLSEGLTKYIETSEKPFLTFAPKDKFAEAYCDFYRTLAK